MKPPTKAELMDAMELEIKQLSDASICTEMYVYGVLAIAERYKDTLQRFYNLNLNYPTTAEVTL